MDGHKPGEPGLYRRGGDGALRAVNLPPIIPDPSPKPSDPRAKLARFRSLGKGRFDATPAAIFAALGCVILAALAAPRQRLTPIRDARTV
jgi:hypothetical protein